MKWTKYTIQTTTEAEDIISAMLMEYGVEGIEIENSLPPTGAEFEAMYIDPQPELLPDEAPALPEGISLLSFYIRCEEDDAESALGAPLSSEAAADAASDDSYTIHDRTWTQEEVCALLEQIRNGLNEISGYADIGEGSISSSESDEDDWRNNWKDYFKPQQMGDIIIKPSWASITDEQAAAVAAGDIHVIEMDPGTAFGTGSHETTRLCVEGLAHYLEPGQTVLDIGTGSGILGLCALCRGASYVMATELDPDCEHIISDNIALNPDIADSRNFKLLIGNILNDQSIIDEVSGHGPYDIIVSNILAPVIAALAGSGQADHFAEKGTVFITSGIIDTKEETVVNAFAGNPAWEILGVEHMGEWVSVIARRK